jgi:hypothetical protein|tara:strand:- start:5009 stop:5338 length:330 start_codon:yes stop_codon:yes gene_type:complete
MATTFENKIIKDIGVLPVLAVETDAGTRSTIIGMQLSNLTESVVYTSVSIKDSDSVHAYFIKDVMLPPNSSLPVLRSGEKLILSPSNALYIVSDEDDSIDAILSYVDIV